MDTQKIEMESNSSLTGGNASLKQLSRSSDGKLTKEQAVKRQKQSVNEYKAVSKIEHSPLQAQGSVMSQRPLMPKISPLNPTSAGNATNTVNEDSINFEVSDELKSNEDDIVYLNGIDEDKETSKSVKVGKLISASNVDDSGTSTDHCITKSMLEKVCDNVRMNPMLGFWRITRANSETYEYLSEVFQEIVNEWKHELHTVSKQRQNEDPSINKECLRHCIYRHKQLVLPSEDDELLLSPEWFIKREH